MGLTSCSIQFSRNMTVGQVTQTGKILRRYGLQVLLERMFVMQSNDHQLQKYCDIHFVVRLLVGVLLCLMAWRDTESVLCCCGCRTVPEVPLFGSPLLFLVMMHDYLGRNCASLFLFQKRGGTREIRGSLGILHNGHMMWLDCSNPEDSLTSFDDSVLAYSSRFQGRHLSNSSFGTLRSRRGRRRWREGVA